MRCVYCHDLLAGDWIEMEHGLRVHRVCAVIMWSQRRQVEEKGVAGETPELSDEDAQRMIRAWESELSDTSSEK